MKGVILAGGKGMRLRPLTERLPKPMLPLLDKPVMEYSIELLKKSGINEIAIMIQYYGHIIKEYFGTGEKWGVKLSYFEDTPPLGTVGSIKAVESFFDETFLVISGDALTNIDLSEGIAFHQQRKSVFTILTKEEKNPQDFGTMTLDAKGLIMKYVEKPKIEDVFSNIVNTGIYIIEPEVLREVPSQCFADFSQHLIPKLLRKRKGVYGYVTSGYWLDIGTFQRYRKAQIDLLNKKTMIVLTR